MNSTVPSGLTKIDAGMLGATLLAHVVLARPLVVDRGAELLLEIACEGVTPRTRMPLHSDLQLALRVDVDEDRGTWHRFSLPGARDYWTTRWTYPFCSIRCRTRRPVRSTARMEACTA